MVVVGVCRSPLMTSVHASPRPGGACFNARFKKKKKKKVIILRVERKKNMVTRKGSIHTFSAFFESADLALNRRAFQQSAFSKYACANPNKTLAKPDVLSCPHLYAKI